MDDRLKCQTATATPAKPGELPFWFRRQLDYIGWAKRVVAGLPGASPWLEQQFNRAAMEAERSIDVVAVRH